MRSAFANVMESAGYDRYSSYSIADWFKYTNFAEYFTGYYWDKLLPVCCYIVLIFSIVFTILVNREAKKEIVVYMDSVLCRVIAIGKPTVSTFPAFPPLHTVHESFPSHGVPSIKLHFHCHKLLQAV